MCARARQRVLRPLGSVSGTVEHQGLLLVVEDGPDLEHFNLHQGEIGTPEEPWVTVPSRSPRRQLWLSPGLPQHDLAMRSVTQHFWAFYAVGRHGSRAVWWDSDGRYLSTSAVMDYVSQGLFNLVKELPIRERQWDNSSYTWTRRVLWSQMQLDNRRHPD